MRDESQFDSGLVHAQREGKQDRKPRSWEWAARYLPGGLSQDVRTLAILAMTCNGWRMA